MVAQSEIGRSGYSGGTARRAHAAAAWLRGWLAEAVAEQTDRWFLWVPVCLAAGIGIYFALPVEPHWLVFVVALAGAAGLTARALKGIGQPLSLFLAVLLAGFVLTKMRTEVVRHKTLAATTGAVEVKGWVEAAEPATSKRLRLTLRIDDVEGIRAEAEPEVARVTAKAPANVPPLGSYISIKARLLPLPGPVEPGGYDAALGLWFEGIGATGIGFGEPVIDRERSVDRSWSPRAIIEAVRGAIGERVARALPAESAGFATALITGERAAIPPETQSALQISGLAHILSISGLHMTLMAGSVFWLLRAGLALFPGLALRYPIKKWAALGTLIAGFCYLMISGLGVATQRSYVMLAVMCIAVLLDRPAITMRNLALAGLIVILLAPESVFTASFQMSFLAVMGLIAFYEAISDWRRNQFHDSWPGGLAGRAAVWGLMAFLAMGATTLVASVFTALPAAYHFNRVSSLSLLANLLALPIVSAVVMPMALAAVVAMPLGLEAWPLRLMGLAIQWVADIAHWVAGLPGAAGVVPGMPAMAAMTMSFGAIWLCLWRGRLRLFALPLIAAGLALAPFASRPDILVDRTARNVVVRNADGFLVPAERRRGRYAVEKWLLEDGDGAALSEAAARPGWSCANKICRAEIKGRRLIYLKDGADAAAACRGPDIVVAEFPLRRNCGNARLRIDRFDVWRHGAYAVFLRDGGVEVVTADELRGQRPWVVRPVPRGSIRETAAAAE